MVGLYVEFKAKSTEIDNTFKKMEQQISSLQNKATKAKLFDDVSKKARELSASILHYGKYVALGITAAGVGLGLLINKIAEDIDHVTDSARALGTSAQGFQALSYGASLSGVSIEAMEGSLRKMNMGIGQAITGNDELKQTFKSLGVSLESLQGKNMDQQFLIIADALGKIKDKNIQAAMAASIFGRSYSDVLNLVRDGVSDTVKEFDKLGLSLTDSQRVAVDAFGDAQTKLSAIFSGFSQKVVAYLAEPFEKVITYITDTITKMGGIDVAAQSFAKAIIGAVSFAVNSLNSLLNLIDSMYVRMLKIQAFGLEAKQSLETTNPLNSVVRAIDSGANATYNTNQTNRQKELGATYANIAEAEKTMKGRNNVLQPAVDILTKGAADMGTALQSTLVPFKTAAQSAAELAQANSLAAKKIEDTLSNFIKTSGQSKLQDVLGTNQKGETAQIVNKEWDDLIRTIYDKALNGTGGQVQKGFVNGKGFTNRVATAGEDLTSLEDKVKAQSLGGNISAITGYIGALDELKAFLAKMDPNANKVKVDIEVKTEEGFILKIAQSQAMDQQMKKTLLDATSLNARAMGAK